MYEIYELYGANGEMTDIAEKAIHRLHFQLPGKCNLQVQ